MESWVSRAAAAAGMPAAQAITLAAIFRPARIACNRFRDWHNAYRCVNSAPTDRIPQGASGGSHCARPLAEKGCDWPKYTLSLSRSFPPPSCSRLCMLSPCCPHTASLSLPSLLSWFSFCSSIPIQTMFRHSRALPNYQIRACSRGAPSCRLDTDRLADRLHQASAMRSTLSSNRYDNR